MCRCGNMIIINPANLICGVFFDLIGINKLVFKKDKIISVALFGSSLWARNYIPCLQSNTKNPAIAGFFYIQKVTNHLLLFTNHINFKNQT